MPLAEPLVSHVLLIHSSDGLVLVDSGFGLQDRNKRQGRQRLGIMRHLIRFDQDDSTTAVEQLRQRGHQPAEVRHIVMTHLDLDHSGGLADFPDATVHTTAAEHAAAMHPDLRDRQRYRRRHWEHDPAFVLHHGPGHQWQFGLTAHQVLPGISLIPMPGHTRGHAAVAVDAGERGLLLHAGDAAFDASTYSATTPAGEPLQRWLALRAFERAVGRDAKAIAANHEILRRLNNEPAVTVIPAHDPRIFRAMTRPT
ncbi:MAG: MBL fold metallo-hydrolase [Microbacterium sp.]